MGMSRAIRRQEKGRSQSPLFTVCLHTISQQNKQDIYVRKKKKGQAGFCPFFLFLFGLLLLFSCCQNETYIHTYRFVANTE
jgi:hypothetical protein